MAPRLPKNKVGSKCTGARNSDNNDFTHCNFVEVAAIAQYLASVEE